jgi:hypothetical protein
VSRRDTLAAESPEILATRGFSSWLKANIPRLKRGRAIKYATGFRSLSLPLTAKPADIQAKVKTLFHEADKAKKPRPNLADLVKAAPKPSKPETLTILLPKSSKQLKLEDARETSTAKVSNNSRTSPPPSATASTPDSSNSHELS